MRKWYIHCTRQLKSEDYMCPLESQQPNLLRRSLCRFANFTCFGGANTK